MKLSLSILASLAGLSTASYPTPERIRELLAPLSTSNSTSFFNDVLSDDLKWTSLGSFKYAGTYTKQTLLTNALEPFEKVFKTPLVNDVGQITGGIDSPWSVVELAARDVVCKNGLKYDQHTVWVMKWDGEQVVEVREYLDTALTEKAIEENS